MIDLGGSSVVEEEEKYGKKRKKVDPKHANLTTAPDPFRCFFMMLPASLADPRRPVQNASLLIPLHAPFDPSIDRESMEMPVPS